MLYKEIQMKMPLLCSILLIGSIQKVAAQDTSQLKADFKQAYASFQNALDNADIEQVKLTAKKSYELGCQAYERTSETCQTLTLNYAQVMDELKGFEASEEVYRDAIEKMGDKYGSDSIEVGELALFVMTKIYSHSNQDAVDFITGFLSYRIEDAANELEGTDPRAAGDFWLRAIQIYNRHGFRNKKEILTAYKLIKKHSNEENKQLITCRFMAAKYYYHKRDIQDSIELHEENIKAIESLNDPELEKLEIKTRGLLITSYQKDNNVKMIEKHVMGLAKIMPWSRTAEPIYRTISEYPEFAWRNNKEGTVILRFDLDEVGRPSNIEVVSADHGNTFKRSAKESLKKWRFLPKFENGKPVKVKGLETAISYTLAK